MECPLNPAIAEGAAIDVCYFRIQIKFGLDMLWNVKDLECEWTVGCWWLKCGNECDESIVGGWNVHNECGEMVVGAWGMKSVVAVVH
ncbi:hypothetical protein HNY73_014765 [Argiope bruennichi]|uniref:Uncharacterized protein n=1 Tax=Argiope bruennichi TaxID=94029 RepID=A0A8T0ER82_ARGBR|nr:hypothetical protein HNY73_014765 [Argiope bruennichi]